MKWVILLVVLLIAGAVIGILSHPAFGLYRHRSTERLQQSPNWRDGKFHNQLHTPQFTGQMNMLSAMRQMVAKSDVARVPATPVPAIKTNLHALPTDTDWVVWFGHSSYLFTLGGKRYLVDPVLTRSFPASLMMKPFAGTDIYRPDDLPDIDVLIITHEHWDHADYATLRALCGRVDKVFCPLGMADYLRYWGYADSRIVEMDWYDSYPNAAESTQPAVTITCLPSRHFSNRLLKRDQTLWASFMVESAGRKVYIGGDGGYDGRFRQIREQFGQIDLAFLENGQYNDNWRYIHTTPEDLEKVMLDLQAEQYFTVHHDKYALAMHAWNEPDSVAHVIAGTHHLHLLDAPIGKQVKY